MNVQETAVQTTTAKVAAKPARARTWERRFLAWFSWLVWAIVFVLLASAAYLGVLISPSQPIVSLLNPLQFLAFATVGALIASLRPGNSIGWIFLAIGLMNSTWLLAGEYTLYASANPGVWPA